MSAYAGIIIGGVEVYEYSNHYDRWFFRKRDRIIECLSNDEHNDGVCAAQTFIGFRATFGTIRKRMTLTGSDMTACERYFSQSMGKLLGFLQNEIASLDEICDGYRISEGGNSRGARHLDVYTRFVSAVRNTSLADWVAAFP